MRALKLTGLAVLFVVLAVAVSIAGMETGRGAMQSGMYDSSVMGEGGIFYSGKLSGLGAPGREILVKTIVPGLLGPTEKTLPFKVAKDTTVNICFRSINRCDAAASGIEGWRMLTALDGFESLSGVTKNVTVIGVAAGDVPDKVVHVQIEYDL